MLLPVDTDWRRVLYIVSLRIPALSQKKPIVSRGKVQYLKTCLNTRFYLFRFYRFRYRCGIPTLRTIYQ